MGISPGRFQLLILICQTIGISNINSVPTLAASHGTVGCVLVFLVIYIILGIPLLYMELIIGQFTGRNCVEAWQIRPFLSYTGYVMILWQFVILIYNHAFVAFIVYYFLISFENPIPYYTCGPWSTRDCNILLHNYTVNEDCVRSRRPDSYCDNVHTTFPEYQYWRNHVLQVNKNTFTVAWRICLASGLVCAILYLSCFKRKKSFEYIVYLPLYPILGFVIFMLASMLQKGLTVKFEEALDLNFSDFSKKFRLANAIQQIVYSLGVGSGITISYASSSSFRSNCFSNSVITVVVSAVFTVLVVCTTTMMSCPYAYHYSVSPGSVINTQMSLIFEKIPRLLSQYENRLLWLILLYSCYAATGLCTNVIIFYNLIETVAMKYQKLANYSGLTYVIAIVFVFLATIPLLSNFGVIFSIAFRRYVTLISIFFVIIENIVFVVSYGVHRFSEDVHFMLGIQPSFFMKTAWILASVLLGFAFCAEILYYYKYYLKNYPSTTDFLGICLVLIVCGVIVVLSVGKLVVSLFRKRFMKALKQKQDWGPQSDVLQRSRAMFSAQAMTKEYMYRQYHLQAGITSRQRNANKRSTSAFDEQRYSL